MRPKILLIDSEKRGQHYAEIQEALDADWLPGEGWTQRGSYPESIDLAMAADEYRSENSTLITELVRREVPVLHLVDGILEWRNTWENPRSRSQDSGMPLFQPVLSHKVACLGRSQARLLESWGSVGKCEIVGRPRFDALIGRQPRKRRPDEPFRVLVMTARKPAFTADGMRRVERSLADLRQAFAVHDGPRLEPVWRLTTNLAEKLDVHSRIADLSGRELAEVLAQVDAVITTPSTAMLEAMLCGLPVALLDYHNCPHYVPAAWRITAPEHIAETLSELVEPPRAKLIYQDTVLHDALECRTPATPRLAQLIERMIEIREACRREHRPLGFPDRILPDEHDRHHAPEPRFEMAKLYPDHPTFGDPDRVALQAEVGHLRRELQRIKASPFWRLVHRLRSLDRKVRKGALARRRAARKSMN